MVHVLRSYDANYLPIFGSRTIAILIDLPSECVGRFASMNEASAEKDHPAIRQAPRSRPPNEVAGLPERRDAR